MGTRSTYRLIEQFDSNGKTNSNELCLIYVQYDGYPEGHPLDTATFLSKGKVVNGLGTKDKDTLVFNGGGCLAAQLICQLKDGKPGNTYIHPLSHRGQCGEDYLYDIIIKNDRTIEFVCINNWESTELFRGSPEDFVKKYEKEVVV